MDTSNKLFEPQNVPEPIRNFLSLKEVNLPIDEVYGKIFKYIRDNNLYNKEYLIYPDKALQKLFFLREDETINLDQLLKLVCNNYPNPNIEQIKFEVFDMDDYETYNKIIKLESEISSLKKINKDILIKLDEQMIKN